MRINNITTRIYTTGNTSLKRSEPVKKTHGGEEQTQAAVPYGYSYISFKKKKIDTAAETQKLLKQFDDLLESDLDIEQLLRLYERQIMTQMQAKDRRLQQILQEAEEIADSMYMSNTQKHEKLVALKKEFNTLEKNYSKIKPFAAPKPLDPRVDNALIRKFQTAINEDNFNLDKVFKEYYKDLNTIKTLEDLHKKYPKIDIPSDPAYVAADKIQEVLTRDFYEQLDRLMRKKDEQKIYDFLTSKIRDTLPQNDPDSKHIYAMVSIPAAGSILDKYEKLRETNSFSTVPQFRKNTTVKLSENDKKLLSVDYDDFVLSVLRQQYLENKKTSEITYTYKDVTIPVSTLKESYYKFEKIPERVKSIISTAKKIQEAKRDYENFDNDQLRGCLTQHAELDAGDNELILERIIAFDSCHFTKEDKKSLIALLRVLDSVHDGDISETDAVKIIKKENIRPAETERLNEIEKQKILDSIKRKQKINTELNYIKSEFDNAMNILYQNDLGSTAAVCAKYRPKNFDVKQNLKSKSIIELITQEPFNPAKIKNTVKNWDTYYYYKDNERNNPYFIKAKEFAKKQDGSVDLNKAGMYLNCAATAANGAQNIESAEKKSFIQEIIDRSSSLDTAIEYLCKYAEYEELPADTKSHLCDFVDMFNRKDNVEKFILKYIIENDYINSDTVSPAKINDNDTVDVTIAANAKKQILEKYKYPRCLDFMYDFEKFMTTLATDKGSSGIKKITRGNKTMDYKMELKLVNHDDRLLASKKDYYFDEFLAKGFH